MKKKLSLKLRISLWFTLFLVLITTAFFGAAISIYMSYYSEDIKNQLVEVVSEEAALLEEDKGLRESVTEGELSETYFLREDIKLMVYDEDGEEVAGLFIYDELDDKEYSKADKPKKIEINGVLYYYYDVKVNVHHGTDYYVRGIVRAEESISGILMDHVGIALLIPLLIIVAFFGGYFLTGRFLLPIKKIDETTEEIRQSGDLTKRIEFTDNGDELSKLSAHINSMFDTLQDNFEAEKQFTSSASHELRTPVSVILAQCEYAIENAQTKEEIQDAVSSIQKQGYKMSRLIEALLMFTRMEQGTEKYPMEVENVSEIVMSSCEDFSIIADKNIEIIPKVQENVMREVNRELFSLMVNNLIQNAIRYGREDGHVYVELKKEGEKITLSVIDDGIGIAKEDIPHIFDVFYRADKSRNSKGLGLGLSLVKRITEFHNGKISVQSKSNNGSTFCCTFNA
ncbi:MAG: HAMP domain-containing histidine kinase [Butyrivibrio sp.]|nr:HAMP domain-containing histidine kinase [Butyrivibrio sp.]